MAETKSKARRRRADPGIRIQDYLTSSSSPEEILFKINEMIYSQESASSRKNIRVPISIPVSYRVQDKSYDTNTYTLSRDGVFIKTPAPPAKSTQISLVLSLPDDAEAIEAEGKVINSLAFQDALSENAVSGMAVVFSSIRDSDRRRIHRFVKSKARKIFKP